MRNIYDFLKESLETSMYVESKGTWFRVITPDKELISSIKNIGQDNKVYTEFIDNGIKFEIKPGQEEKVHNFLELLTDYIDALKDEKETDEKDIEKIQSVVDKMHDFIDDFDEEE